MTASSEATEPLVPRESRERAKARERVERLHNQATAAKARYERLISDRTDAFIAARELSPPLTFREIGQLCGITEAAVQQMITKKLGPAATR